MTTSELKKNIERVEDAIDLFMEFQVKDPDLYPVIEGVESENDKAIEKTIRALDRLKKHIYTAMEYAD